LVCTKYADNGLGDNGPGRLSVGCAVGFHDVPFTTTDVTACPVFGIHATLLGFTAMILLASTDPEKLMTGCANALEPNARTITTIANRRMIYPPKKCGQLPHEIAQRQPPRSAKPQRLQIRLNSQMQLTGQLM
jgi:hypothetical protein